eukprot:jgi/Mesvir1/19823/Mv13113-RA.1
MGVNFKTLFKGFTALFLADAVLAVYIGILMRKATLLHKERMKGRVAIKGKVTTMEDGGCLDASLVGPLTVRSCKAQVEWSHELKTGSATVSVFGNVNVGDEVTLYFDPKSDIGIISEPADDQLNKKKLGVMAGIAGSVALISGLLAVVFYKKSAVPLAPLKHSPQGDTTVHPANQFFNLVTPPPDRPTTL